MKKVSRLARLRQKHAREWKRLLDRHYLEVSVMLVRFDHEQRTYLRPKKSATRAPEARPQP